MQGNGPTPARLRAAHHALPETSLMVEVFTPDHRPLARGARRPVRPSAGLLMAFQPWSSAGSAGRGKTLMKAEWQGPVPLLTGQALLSAIISTNCCPPAARRRPSALFERYARNLARLGADWRADAAPTARLRKGAAAGTRLRTDPDNGQRRPGHPPRPTTITSGAGRCAGRATKPKVALAAPCSTWPRFFGTATRKPTS